MFIGMYKNNNSKHNNVEALYFILLCLIIMFTVILKGRGGAKKIISIYTFVSFSLHII